MFAIYKKMKELGLLGINRRNADYIRLYNKRAYFPLVDDKLRTKQLAQQAGLPVPELYGVISIEHEVATLGELLKPYDQFVIKPAQGSGGDGIIVVTGKRKNRYLKSNGALISQEELEHHASNILSGMYSLGGHTDKALIEYCVQFDPLFNEVSYRGVPDIRIIVFLGYPVMGMIRLPTRQSQGKANLHQGAIGVGIDLSTGKTLRGVWQNQVTDSHPDTDNDIEGLQLPQWDTLLEMAARCYELTGLGFLGVDIVLDKTKGPMILELNARPGLSIQIANRQGLLPRLQLIESLTEHATPLLDRLNSPLDRVAFCKKQFSQLNLKPSLKGSSQ